MRLIDADKLILSLSDWELQNAPLKVGNQPKEFTSFDMDCMVWKTIRDCESAVEEQPTVKAIPIEWIEKWAEKWYKSEYTTMEYSRSTTNIGQMIEDWEKENETN